MRCVLFHCRQRMALMTNKYCCVLMRNLMQKFIYLTAVVYIQTKSVLKKELENKKIIIGLPLIYFKSLHSNSLEPISH